MTTGFSKKIVACILFILFWTICFAFVEIQELADSMIVQKNAPTFLFDLEEQYYPCDYSNYYYDANGDEIAPEDAIKKYKDNWAKNRKSEVFYSISQKNDKTIIQYWLFYVFNDFLNKHYGDAETITVIIDPQKNEKTIIGSAHIGNISKIAVANNQATQLIDSPINILVELGSHANCPDPNGNAILEPRELDNWYNAYGISNWDEYDKKGIRLSKNEYELMPLSVLEEKLKGKEKLKNTDSLGWEINLKGDFFGYEFSKNITLPFGGESVDLASIEPLKKDPVIAMPFSLGKDFNRMTDLMIKNYSTQNPYRSDISELFLEKKSESEKTEKDNAPETLKDTKKTDSIDEKQRLLEENEKLKKAIYDISIQVAQLQKQVDQLSAQKLSKKVKGASIKNDSNSPVLITEIASGVDNSSQEYIQIYNKSEDDLNLSDNFSFYIISGDKKTKKQIHWINPIIKSKSHAILSDKSLSSKISANGYYSAGISQNFEISIEYLQDKDFVSFKDQNLETGYCAKREKNNKEYGNLFSISQECIIKTSFQQNKKESNQTISKTQGNGSYQKVNTTAPVFHPVIINEIMYDPQGKESDREWIEIYNNSSSSINLIDWKLFENNTNHGLTLEQGSLNIAPFGFAIIAQDKQEFLKDYPDFDGTILRASFLLSDNEVLEIKNKDLQIDKVEYSKNYGAKDNGYSLQLINNGWQESIPTPGKENIKKYHDLIADFSFEPKNPVIGENIIFNASSSQIFSEITSFNWTIASTSINSTSSILNYIFNATGTYEISLTVSNKYFSTSSSATGSIIISEDISKETIATSSQESNQAVPNSIIINEIVYNPEGSDEGNEWIEIKNISDQSIDLKDWKFFENSTNHELLFASSSILGQNGFAIISDDNEKFMEKYPAFSGVLFKSSFSLSNNSELLAIKDNNLFIINQYTYSSSTGAYENNNSLQLIADIWQEACPTPGNENKSGLCQIQENPILGTYSDPTPEQINNLSSQTTSTEQILPLTTSTESTSTNATSI